MFIVVIILIAAVALVAWFMSSNENEEAKKARLEEIAETLFTYSESMRGTLGDLDEISFYIDYNPVVYEGRVGYGMKYLAVYAMDETGEGSGVAKNAGMEVTVAEKDGLVYYKYVAKRSEVAKTDKDTVTKLWAAKYAEKHPDDLIMKDPKDGFITVYAAIDVVAKAIIAKIKAES